MPLKASDLVLALHVRLHVLICLRVKLMSMIIKFKLDKAGVDGQI